MKIEKSLERYLASERNKLNNDENKVYIKNIENEIWNLYKKSWYRSRHSSHCYLCNGAKYSEKNRIKNFNNQRIDLGINDYHYTKKRNIIK